VLLGSHFLHPDRFLYGRLSFSVELVYRRNPTGGFDLNAARDRVRLARGKGAKVALRVDDAPGQSLPVNGDEAGAHAYAQWCQMLATDHIMRDCDWLICGNEPNLVAENREAGSPCPPSWAARVVYGHGKPPEDTSNVYQFVRTVHPTMQVLLPAVAPYSPEASGARAMPNPFLDGRPQWAPWESYQFDLMQCAYDNAWHADLGEVKTAVHTYAAQGVAAIGPGEPAADQREPTFRAQFGSRWMGDCLWLLRQAQKAVYNSEWNVWVLCSEANIYRPPQTPEQDYASGWWQQLVSYVNGLPNVMGLAAFVDQDYGAGWANTAMTSGLGRCPQWNTDHDALLRNGWS